MKRGVTSLGAVLKREKDRKTGFSKSIALAELAVSWDKAMKGHFAVNSAVHSMKDGVLYVAVEEPAWAQQMSMMKRHILESFRAQCDLDGVKDIRFGAFGSTEMGSLTDGPAGKWTVAPDEGGRDLSPASGAILERLGDRLPAGARQILMANLQDGERVGEGVLSRCAVCSLPVAGKARYCPVCAIKPNPAKLKEAVACLMDCPVSDDSSVVAVCGLDRVDDTYGILKEARRIAGTRLADEAIRLFHKSGGGPAGSSAARPLLVASACASSGMKPEEAQQAGLRNFLPAMLLLDVGISPFTDIENASKEG